MRSKFRIFISSIFVALAACATKDTHHTPSVAKPVTAENVASCTDCSSDAINLANHLNLLGFNCTYGPVNLQRGFRCQGRVGDYPLPTDFFIPPLLNFAKPVALAYHLHGWWQTPSDSPFAGANGDYGSFVASSQANLILMIPESQGRDLTYASDLNTATKLNTFLEQHEALLLHATVPITDATNKLITGHSGAYVAIGNIGNWISAGQIPRLRGLKGVALLDAAYGYRSGFSQLMDAMCGNAPATYLLTYNPNDGNTSKRDTYVKVWNELKTTHLCKSANLIYLPDTNSAHVEFPRHHLPDFYRQSLQ